MQKFACIYFYLPRNNTPRKITNLTSKWNVRRKHRRVNLKHFDRNNFHELLVGYCFFLFSCQSTSYHSSASNLPVQSQSAVIPFPVSYLFLPSQLAGGYQTTTSQLPARYQSPTCQLPVSWLTVISYLPVSCSRHLPHQLRNLQCVIWASITGGRGVEAHLFTLSSLFGWGTVPALRVYIAVISNCICRCSSSFSRNCSSCL